MTATLVFWAAWAAGLGLWLPAGPRLRGLTLRGAWWWAGAAWLAMGAAGATAARGGWWAAPLQYALTAAVFCPVMSVLGAKRPQDRGWHWIVLSLWVVLALPAAEVLVLHPGQEFAAGDARGWFLLALMIVSATHLLPTRHWPSAVLLGAGQLLLFAPLLPLPPAWRLDAPWQLPSAAACLCGAMAAAWRRPPDRPRRWDRLWRDFRDLYGTLWSLRVAQRVNEAAAAGQWGVELRWQGLVDGEGRPAEPADQAAEDLETCLRNLLRRFVSPQWIDARLGERRS